MNRYKQILVIVISILLFAGCNETKEMSESGVVLAGDETVLATVNGSPVTAYELEATIKKTIGEKNASKIGTEVRKKVLESLVASRAISKAFEKDMSSEEGEEVRKKVLAYREQLLVQKYIAKNATPEPVTHEMVKDHYNKYPERFGAKTEKKYEMISTGRALNHKERNLLLKNLVKPESQKNWAKWVKNLKAKNLPVFYKKGNVVKGLLHEDLDAITARLHKGKTSKLHFIDERPYVIRIIDEKMISPRPLTEVSRQIRKTLGPLELKKVVGKISEDVLKTATVEYSEM